jgi:uncharacterized protein
MKFVTFATYRDIPDVVEKLRPLHREYLGELHKTGSLVLAGPFTDGSGAMFVHEVTSPDDVTRILAADPFAAQVFESLLTRPWKPVFATTGALQP